MNTTKLIAFLAIVVLLGGAYLYLSNDGVETNVPMVDDHHDGDNDHEEGEVVGETDDYPTTKVMEESPVEENPPAVKTSVAPTEAPIVPPETTSTEVSSDAVDTTLAGLDTLFDDEYDDSAVDASLEDNLTDPYDI
jgi:hypothetical protein